MRIFNTSRVCTFRNFFRLEWGCVLFAWNVKSSNIISPPKKFIFPAKTLWLLKLKQTNIGMRKQNYVHLLIRNWAPVLWKPKSSEIIVQYRWCGQTLVGYNKGIGIICRMLNTVLCIYFHKYWMRAAATFYPNNLLKRRKGFWLQRDVLHKHLDIISTWPEHEGLLL